MLSGTVASSAIARALMMTASPIAGGPIRGAVGPRLEGDGAGGPMEKVAITISNSFGWRCPRERECAVGGSRKPQSINK